MDERHVRIKMSSKDKQRYVLSSFPGVSDVLAGRLLDRFGSVREVMVQDVDGLMEVNGIGKKISEEIVGILDEKSNEKSNKKL